MLRRTITFRQIFITLCILLIANIAATFICATPSVSNNSNSNDDYYQMDARELGRDYQLELQGNGDITVWEGRRYVGTVPYYKHEKCTLQRIIMADNDQRIHKDGLGIGLNTYYKEGQPIFNQTTTQATACVVV